MMKRDQYEPALLTYYKITLLYKGDCGCIAKYNEAK